MRGGDAPLYGRRDLGGAGPRLGLGGLEGLSVPVRLRHALHRPLRPAHQLRSVVRELQTPHAALQAPAILLAVCRPPGDRVTE